MRRDCDGIRSQWLLWVRPCARHLTDRWHSASTNSQIGEYCYEKLRLTEGLGTMVPNLLSTGSVSWKTIFPGMGVGEGWFGNHSSALLLLCTLFLLLLYQPHLRSSGIRFWRLETSGLGRYCWSVWLWKPKFLASCHVARRLFLTSLLLPFCDSRREESGEVSVSAPQPPTFISAPQKLGLTVVSEDFTPSVSPSLLGGGDVDRLVAGGVGGRTQAGCATSREWFHLWAWCAVVSHNQYLLFFSSSSSSSLLLLSFLLPETPVQLLVMTTLLRNTVSPLQREMLNPSNFSNPQLDVFQNVRVNSMQFFHFHAIFSFRCK